jgi:hypothetical protein
MMDDCITCVLAVMDQDAHYRPHEDVHSPGTDKGFNRCQQAGPSITYSEFGRMTDSFTGPRAGGSIKIANPRSPAPTFPILFPYDQRP